MQKAFSPWDTEMLVYGEISFSVIEHIMNVYGLRDLDPQCCLERFALLTLAIRTLFQVVNNHQWLLAETTLQERSGEAIQGSYKQHLQGVKPLSCSRSMLEKPPAAPGQQIRKDLEKDVRLSPRK